MLLHWIWFSGLGMTDWAKNKLLQHFSDPEDIYFAQDRALQDVQHLTPEARAILADKDLSAAQKILDTCRARGIHILTLRDAAYPSRLRHIGDPPMVLYYKGILPDLDSLPAIGVVGTRKASAYGMHTARKLGYQIARCGGVIVSGLASGIDAMAMSGGLDAGQSVVGVLGCGVDIVYPASNRDLFRATERYGCILSEFAPGTQPVKWNFPRRNRIISGLCSGVLVVEAPRKSGALITARSALEQGRDVFVVPGNIDTDTCAGSNRLLRDGAIPVSSGWDILGEYASLYPDKIRKAEESYPHPDTGAQWENSLRQRLKNPSSGGKEKAIDPLEHKKVIDKEPSSSYSDVNDILLKLSPEERAIVDILAGGTRLVDDVIAQTGLSTGKVLAILTVLELKKVITRHPGKRISLK